MAWHAVEDKGQGLIEIEIETVTEKAAHTEKTAHTLEDAAS